MGRDVTGLRVSSVKANPTGVSKTSTSISEAKPSVKEGVIEVPPDENSSAEATGVSSVKAKPTTVSKISTAISEAKPSVKEGVIEVLPDENSSADTKSLRVSSVKEKPTGVSKTSTAISEAKPSVKEGVIEVLPVENSSADATGLRVSSVKAKPTGVSKTSTATSEAKPSVKEGVFEVENSSADATGLHVSSVKAKPTGVSKTSTAISEAKPSVKEVTIEVPPVENSSAVVTGLRVSSVKAKLAGVSKTSTAVSKAKPSVKEGVIVVPPAENSSAKHDVLGAKTPDLKDAKNDVKSSKIEETKSSSPDKSGDQHVYVSPIAAETPELCSSTSPNLNILPSPSSSKKTQPNSPFLSRKHLDNEDNWSIASSTIASVRSARFKTTVPLAPKFCVTDRLEKRKEFYSKLEEKHKALEEEKREYESRNKEEEHAAIKQMRKSMVYKANPVPDFYYQAPPPKKELKKLPTTRAVSPKFGRRKSFGDAMGSSAVEKVASARVARHSLGGYNHNSKQSSITSTSTPKKKGPVPEQNGKGGIKKERPKQQAKGSSPAPAQEPVAVAQNMTEQTNANISVQS